MDLSIIIVSWNVRELLHHCLQSILQSLPPADASEPERVREDGTRTAPRGPATEIIVVDNASSDGTVEMLRTEFPQIGVIANRANVGFTRANNQALALAQGRYLFLLNPDTQVQPGALAGLVDYMETHAETGLIGPQLRYGDGSLQSSRRRFPTLATAFLESTPLQRWFPHHPLLTRYYMLDTPDDATQPVDWVNGSAMFVRRAVYAQVGGLDEVFFMYSEELDWCYRIKQAGWQIVYLPSVQITHYEGKSSEQAVAQRDIHFNTSKIRFYAKYRGAWIAALLRIYLLLTFAFQLAKESVKWLLGHKRPLRAARVRAYWQVLASGLK